MGIRATCACPKEHVPRVGSPVRGFVAMERRVVLAPGNTGTAVFVDVVAEVHDQVWFGVGVMARPTGERVLSAV